MSVSVPKVLEHSDESVEETRELVLRGENLTHFEEDCARRLKALQLLSLSQNKFSKLTHFHYFVALQEVHRLCSLHCNYQILAAIVVCS